MQVTTSNQMFHGPGKDGDMRFRSNSVYRHACFCSLKKIQPTKMKTCAFLFQPSGQNFFLPDTQLGWYFPEKSKPWFMDLWKCNNDVGILNRKLLKVVVSFRKKRKIPHIRPCIKQSTREFQKLILAFDKSDTSCKVHRELPVQAYVICASLCSIHFSLSPLD